MEPRKLWMRWLDFRRLRDLFYLVAARDCELTAKDINRLGIAEGVLLNGEGTPFKPSTLYHYRRTLERLGLVRVQERHYCVSREDLTVADLASCPKAGAPLTTRERESLATLVIRNQDCYDSFFKVFTSSDVRPYSVTDLLNNSGPVVLRVEASGGDGPLIRLRNDETGLSSATVGANAAQAILWGLKPWCQDQLKLIDELLLPQGDHVLFTTLLGVPWPSEETARRLLELVHFESSWATLRVQDLILTAGRQWHLPSSSVRETLTWLVRRFPEAVATVSTSEQFVLHGLHRSQREAALSSYVRLSNGEFISHLHIHARLLPLLRVKGGERARG